MKRWKGLLPLFLAAVMFFSTGCQSLLKLTYQNDDFEWLDAQSVAKLVIQSTRDKGFRFVVTDDLTMVELKESLASAMPVEEKSTLEPDYIFEFSTYANEVSRFFYVAGSGPKENAGNFYSDEGTWLVLSRIDSTIFNNLYSLRKPRDFFNGYYGSILEAVKLVQDDYKTKNVGVMINEDKEMLKFQMSYEILDFNIALNELDATPVSAETEVPLVMKILTRGFTTDSYTAFVEVRDNRSRKTRTYYIRSVYDESWQIEVTDERPEGF